MNPEKQRGMALSALVVWAVVIAVVGVAIIQILPALMEYYKVGQAVKAVAAESSGKTVPDLRQAFGKYAEVEHLSVIGPADLEIFKEDSKVVIAFGYEKRIPLGPHVSLLIDFRGSSTGRNYGP